MSSPDISGLDLTDDEYQVVQSLIRNKYKAYDSAGNLVLKGKQKMFKLKEEFPFTDGDGNEAFTVKAGGILDVAGNYALIDSRTDQPVVTLDENLTLLTDKWKIRDPDTEAMLAEIESKSTLVSFLRHIHAIFSLIPHEYEITDANGGHVGTIDGQFSFKDKYDVEIDDASGVPKEAVVASAMVIDAIEGN
ncbi:LURP-one-related/scramblase family protein [Halorussus halophilus]|uniref:LURP-one-related/scramblase family protein n=1 Tax=Halorussus halophilus TaxID=2650975 RepID=UPI00130151DB|nr:hypothetical protein [Halorussus halophilus]